MKNVWSSLTDIDRLVGELISALLTGDNSRIGPDCCAAIDGIDQNCFGVMVDQFNNRGMFTACSICND
ncbi:unnamed protein product [Prunus armeniaca]